MKLKHFNFQQNQSDRNTIRKIKENQACIIKKSSISIDPIYLDIKTLSGGNIEHYYHFLFDLLLPISIILRKTPKNKKIHNKRVWASIKKLNRTF